MLGDSSTALATATTPSGGGAGEAPAAASSHLEAAPHDPERGGGGGADEGDRSLGGNRWPREETLALLRIRSDMDAAFRDASVKGPLWDEVSRKLAELGYNRSAKKCKEKFENVYKYHKRTREGRTGKHEGKTYRFFDQLEAFQSPPPPPPKLQQPLPVVPPPVANPSAPPPPQPLPPPASQITTTTTVPSKNVLDQGIVSTGVNLTNPPPFSISATNPTTNVSSAVMPSFSGDFVSNSMSSSSTSSDVEVQGRKKRKWKEFFEGLMKEVMHKQEEMQKRFLEAIEKREQERMAREESWRMQEMARINREREILAQERSMASAKDAAVMAFLQKISEQQNLGNQQVQHNQLQPPVQQVQTATPPPQPQPPRPAVSQVMQTVSTALPAQQQQLPATTPAPPPVPVQEVRSDTSGDQPGASSSRWPKVEVEALIHLRTTLDSKYQENGPKGPLWEEISAGMRKLGYNRNAKRCKEKWENINKYFKKVKESNKKRPEDSKTCPYFHQLDALYREKSASSRPENSVPLMVQPEQQWPPPPPATSQQPPPHSALDELESDQDNEDEDDEDEAGGYEIVPNRKTPVSSAG